MYIASQIIETIALIITLYAYHLKTKKSIFKGMCIANILDITHYLFLNAYSGLLTKVMALVRNIFILKKILGHKSLDATQIYTHVSNKKLKELMLNFNILDRKERVR